MKKLANHIILSGITVSMLFSPMVAADKPLNPNHLPSGGKFTHGTSGSISGPYFDKNTGRNTIDVTGKTQGGNHVIQWGGGFNIGKDAQVNFGKGQSGQNYLNIAHGTSKSMIEGILNASGNNVFLINPNGVIITKTGGIINANRFVASTTSLQPQHFEEFKAQGAAFSPVFKPNGGNVVNMGNINANNVLLIGNKVDIQGGKVGNKNSTTHLVGNDLVLNPSSFAGNETNYLTALKSVSIAASMSAFKEGGYKFVGADGFTLTNYNEIENKVKKIDFKQYLTINSVDEWAIFADAWNNDRGGKDGTRSVKEFRLIKTIDFENDFKPEYMVGHVYYNPIKDDYDWSNAFTSTFNGNGYALSNIKLDTSSSSNNPYKDYYAGIFSGVDNATIKNLKVKNVDIRSYRSAGGVSGAARNSNFYDISVNGINLHTVNGHAGGLVARIYGEEAGDYERIKIENIKKISANSTGAYTANSAGGVVGVASAGNFKDIKINIVSLIEGGVAGGFGGSFNNNDLRFENIEITNFTNILGKTYQAGGFVGNVELSKEANLNFKNILIENINKIESFMAAAGFSSYIDANVNAKNITIKNIREIRSVKGSVAGFASQIESANSTIHNFENIMINGIGNFYLDSKTSGKTSAAFANTISNGTYKNISINNIEKVTFDDFDSGDFSLFAGYVGGANDKTVFENIIIHGVENIQGRNGKIFSFARDLSGNVELNNVYIFLDGNYQGKEQYLFADTRFGLNEKVSFNNVNVYLKNGVFDRIKDSEATYQGKITFVKFDENELASKKQDFITSAQTATGIQYDQASNSFKTTTDFKVTDPKFSTIGEGGEGSDVEVKLDIDDLYSDVIHSIIKDITNEYYSINIHDLIKILNEYKYEDMNEDQKVEFIKTYFINKSKYDKNTDLDKIARSIVQSLDFLSVYKDSFSESKLNPQALNEYKTILAPKVQEINKYKNEVKDFIQTTLKDKVNKINSANNEFNKQDYYNRLNKLASEYNKYVELINKGLASKDDQAFKEISDMLFTLIAQAQDETEAIERLIKDFEDLKTQVSKNSNGHFVVTGELSAIKIPYPILASIKDDNGGGEIEIPDKPIDPVEPPIDNKPDDSLVFEQSSTFNSIGNKTINEEEEEEEIDETSLLQKGKTCIVSDNYKTMNPCVVGGL
ncbi:filamentous hemagglutinin N-terminal domain-containing protein [Campylobacter lari]|uniref:two-partner secretion domain-containing protein n=2 Tax=Campylobacter TaxID=194 RepID=UPI0013081940|nr:filamentous hemagglutinin N-terminal domain-containing protein [Campylobacter lari]MBT0821056.1 filamentous hemagglutinin N-terminal domain-containing protein [Campylobacter lari]